MSIALIFLMFELIAFQMALDDLPTFLSQIAMVLTHSAGFVKLWMLLYMMNPMEKIRNKLQDGRFKYVPVG